MFDLSLKWPAVSFRTAGVFFSFFLTPSPDYPPWFFFLKFFLLMILPVSTGSFVTGSLPLIIRFRPWPLRAAFFFPCRPLLGFFFSFRFFSDAQAFEG